MNMEQTNKSRHRTLKLGLARTLVFLCFWLADSVLAQQYVQQEQYFDNRANYLARCKSGRDTKCYDDQERATKCLPEFVNAAFNVLVEASNTCGNPPIEYCMQTGVTGAAKLCETCNADVPHLAHPPRFLTDFNINNNDTWWQSETMKEGIQHPSTSVELVLTLGKTFDITYVRLKFHSPRPESFAIFKRLKPDSPWIPFQYYSSDCEFMYQVPESTYARKEHETKALCTSEFSDISPLTGGNVAFSTLEGRPSAHVFEHSSELHEWVAATDIKIVLNRLNTFGDEVFGDHKVLQSYYYAISDLAVGGRCRCNGHASECVASNGLDGSQRLVCCCQHNTAGVDCDRCLPFYNDQPWRRGIGGDPFECKQCNCNGRSQRCFFDKDLYQKTGHGGHCEDCSGNTDGPHCERCKEQFYMRTDGLCLPCHCNEVGSRSLQCNNQGKCQCKPGVTGEKCDRCEPNFYDFSNFGCRSCGCSIAGSPNNVPSCNTDTGKCQCKANVEGDQCNSCKPGYFSLDPDNEFGCTPCFCYGHSSICQSERGYHRYSIESTFIRDTERWTAEDQRGDTIPIQFNALVHNIAVSAPNRDPVYFIAPHRYLGDQRASYNRHLSFQFRINSDGPKATVEDIIIEGSGLTINQPIFGQGNKLPTTTNQEYKFRLHEHLNYGWNPRLSARDFMAVFSNITDIKIRGTYTSDGSPIGFLDNIRLESAQRSGTGQEANWIERCTCPDGYVGQYCESCAAKYRHDPSYGGPFARCVPCNCHGHADICDAETGRCRCNHNTGGENCERCAKGYYGNALDGTPHDCQACPCPNGGACIQLHDGSVACLECPAGYTGHRCDQCTDGYYGDPEGQYGPRRTCQSCDCNNNIDQNAVGNCNRTTGDCLKCIYYTDGVQCERCKDGYYGDALAPGRADCKPCNCHTFGTYGNSLCDQVTGQCYCQPHVRGQHCDRCEDGFWNLNTGRGCESCNCDHRGSVNQTCDLTSGQCTCRPGVTGKHCDQCLPDHFGFSHAGCTDCDCDPVGSQYSQCDDTNGQCVCNNNVEGKRCERCKENKHNKAAGCVDCPPCYNLVQAAVNNHRAKLLDLMNLLRNIDSNPGVIDDSDFERKLRNVQQNVDSLLREAGNSGGDDRNLVKQLADLRNRLADVDGLTSKIKMKTDQALEDSKEAVTNITEAEQTIERVRKVLDEIVVQLDTEGRRSLFEAQRRAEQAGQHSHRMSEIARESRERADKQEMEAEQLEKMAQQAMNTSTEAYRIAKEARDQQSTTRNLVNQLGKEVDSASELLARTLELAQKARKGAELAYSEALSIYTNASGLTLPEPDIQNMIHEAQEIQERAAGLLVDTNDLVSRNKDLLDGLEPLTSEAEDLLERGAEQQQQADLLYADVDGALAKANKAVEMGEKTLEEANKTLETLRGFDKLVKESRDKADEALQAVPEIEQLITEAEQKTGEANRALHGAERNATDAKDIAEEAQRIAEKASQDADMVRDEADKTKDKAGKLKDEADDLSLQVADTGDKLKEYERQSENDKDLAKEALERANEAKNNAEESSKKVQDALTAVQDIQNRLDKLDSVNPAELDQLEARVEAAERSIQDPTLDKRLAELRRARALQSRWMKDYEDELERLRKDVANIEDIRKTLPDGCYRRLVLEP